MSRIYDSQLLTGSRIYDSQLFVGGGGPTYSLTLDAGSYSLSGQNASFTVARTLTLAAGSYTVSGQDAAFTYTPSYTYQLTLETGSYSVSGQSATFVTTALPLSAGGGKTNASNKKKKKQRKAIESEEWLKAEQTAKQLLQDRFTKTTPEAKLEALESHIESLQPVIEALKALTEGVQEPVQETRTDKITEHRLMMHRFSTLERKIESVEELLIILMADL